MTTEAELEARIRETGSLQDRLIECQNRIAAMCSERRPPKMTIPIHWNDDDFFIGVTIKDAIDALIED